MPMRKSTVFLGSLALGIVFFVLLCIHALYSDRNHFHAVKENAQIVERYGLTDLCLFTDARYTRNPAMADIATPFQDHPISLEHFPSGSIISPPAKVAYGLD
jgi:hypothetical protein